MNAEQKIKPATIIITGASGFIGRNLLDDLSTDHRIFAIARRSPHECNAPIHPNIAWLRADIGDWSSISRAFREISTSGGADYLIHLAAYYDFTGDNNPEYKRTNIDGTKHILSLAKKLSLKLFVFASSTAACSYPKDSFFVSEDSPPDGLHIYSQSKSIGEFLVKQSLNEISSCIIRFSAVYSDWCEYPPLYTLINTWLKGGWKSRFLAGKGKTGLPFIHVRDIVSFFRQLLLNFEKVKTGSVLIASTSGFTEHKSIFRLATKSFYGKSKKPVLIPKFITGLGIHLINLLGNPFEKPWMIKYIDQKLNVQNDKTCKLLDWKPSHRLSMEKRLPFLIERYKSEPYAWQSRNLAILKKNAMRPSFFIYNILSEKEEGIIYKVLDRIKQSTLYPSDKTSGAIDDSDLMWQIKLIFKLLITSIHTNNKLLIQNYFEVSGINRFKSGYSNEQINFILDAINHVAWIETSKLDTLENFKREIYDFITLPINFAIDEVELQYKQFLLYKEKNKESFEGKNIREKPKTNRDFLEDTIWQCLVHRK